MNSMNPFYSMRLGAKQQTDFQNLVDFVDIFKRNEGCCDEVWFSTYYGFPKLEQHQLLADKIVESAKYVRKNGISVSLQISNTIGHGSYARVQDFSGFAWDDMVGPDGTHAVYCCCPRDPDFLDYFAELTGYYARIKPDNVWIDDDLRMHHHDPVAYGCFCDRCVAQFNSQFNGNYTRSLLVQAVNDPDSYETRQKLVEFNQQALLGIASTIAREVMKISAASVVGVQQASFAWSSYSGGNYHVLFNGITKITGKASVCRPGGGYYNDHAPRALLDKALNLCLQTQRMPDGMEISQAEVENIPHNVSGKSVHGTLIESAVYLAYGCTSLSYSAFMIPNEKPVFHEPLMAGLADWRGFLTRYAEQNRNTINAGAGIVFSDTPYKMKMLEKKGFAWTHFGRSDVTSLVTYGMPMTWQNSRTPALLLHSEAVDGLSDGELHEIFSGGVITDARSVEKLNSRGMRSILQLGTEPFEELKSIDKATKHPLNGEYAGQSWYHFYTTMSAYPPLKLVVHNKTAEVIGNYALRTDESIVTGVAGVLVKTATGGRVAVFGYNLWTNLVNSAKRHQILKAADWVSGNSMPVFLETPSQVAVVPRVDAGGKLVNTMIINTSIDSSPSLSLELRNCKSDAARWTTPGEEPVSLDTEVDTDGCRTPMRVTIGSMPPWSIGVIETA